MSAADGDAEERRPEVLRRYGIVDAPAPPDLDAVVRLAAHMCEVRAAAVNIVSRDEQHQIAAVGIEETVCSRADSMCAVSIAAPGQVVVPDTRLDPRFAANPWVTSPSKGVRFYAASPLRTAENETLGTLCVFDRRVRSLTPEQCAALDDLAALVVDVLDLHRHRHVVHHALHAADQARTELERSNKALEQFAGQVSHDLKNPLTGILGHASLLADLPPVAGDPRARALAERVERFAVRMNETIEAALAFARLAGRLHLVDTDLGALVRAVLEDLHGDLAAAGGEVRFEGLPTIPCDPVQLRRLLQNLLDNAVKYRRPGRPPRIEVSCDGDPDGWNLRVRDNGRGIPAAQREAALRPFTRLDTTTSGSGIGLAVCVRIAVAHRGTLSVDDAPGGGTVVTCHLPCPPTDTGERGD